MTLTRRSVCLPLLLAGILGPSPVAAQGPSEAGRVAWEIAGANLGWCIEFLVEPDEAEKEMAGGFRPVAASAAAGVHPSITRTITEDPKFATWVPSQLCTWFVSSVTTEGKRYERGDKDLPLAITWWGVATARGEAAWEGRYWLRMAGSNSYPLVRLMQVAKLPMERVAIDHREIRGNELDRIYVTRFNRATIQLTGRFTPDTVQASPEPSKFHGAVAGPFQSMWLSDITLNPEKSGNLSGSLQIFGGRGMAKILNKSPVRLIVSANSGGSGSAQFIRYSK